MGFGVVDGEGDNLGLSIVSKSVSTVSTEQMNYQFDFTEAELAS
jgi:hypothetical protein